MHYLHTMVRIRDIDESLRFYCDGLGLQEVQRKDVPTGKFTLIFWQRQRIFKLLIHPQPSN